MAPVTSLLLWRNNFSAVTSQHLFMDARLASLASYINSSYCEHNIIPLKMIHFTVHPKIIHSKNIVPHLITEPTRVWDFYNTKKHLLPSSLCQRKQNNWLSLSTRSAPQFYNQSQWWVFRAASLVAQLRILEKTILMGKSTLVPEQTSHGLKAIQELKLCTV